MNTFPLRSAAALPLALLALLAGCQSCPPVRAAWYRVETPAGDRLVIALVNEGRRPAALRQVTVNPDDAGGWPLAAGAALAPGEMRVLPLADTAGSGQQWRCRLPVEVALQCDAAPQPDLVRLEGTLPNHLPAGWIEACAPPGTAGSAR